MEPMKWTNVDKSAWPRGPWDSEPDKEQWTDEATGLPCLIVRHREWGNLCGYVGVAPGHPLHGKGYRDPEAESLDVHGGLTFSAACGPSPNGPGYGVCHVTAPGEPDAHWFGFDCAHYLDLTPNSTLNAVRGERAYVYRDVAYVKSECARLAEQVAALAS